MNNEQDSSPQKGRELKRQLPKILQHGGPVMIFGVRPLSSKGSVDVSESVDGSANGLSDRSVEQTTNIGEK